MTRLASAHWLRLFLPSALSAAACAFFEIERAFVQRAPGDRADDAFGHQLRAQRLHVLELFRPPEAMIGVLMACASLKRRVDVDAGQHAVAADVGVDDRLDAVFLELLREVDHVVAGHLRPAVDRDLAVLRVEPDDDVAGEGVAGVVTGSPGSSPRRCR